jgi:glycogen operon protein
MSEHRWGEGSAKSLQVYLSGERGADPGPRGEAIRDATFVLLLHAGSSSLSFRLPNRDWGDAWIVALETGEVQRDLFFSAGTAIEVEARSLVLLQLRDRADGGSLDEASPTTNATPEPGPLEVSN